MLMHRPSKRHKKEMGFSVGSDAPSKEARRSWLATCQPPGSVLAHCSARYQREVCHLPAPAESLVATTNQSQLGAMAAPRTSEEFFRRRCRSRFRPRTPPRSRRRHHEPSLATPPPPPLRTRLPWGRAARGYTVAVLYGRRGVYSSGRVHCLVHMYYVCTDSGWR